MAASLCRRHSSPVGQPLDVDDLLSEILLRLPPQPSSLPRASLVCSRWRRLVSNRSFVRRFRLHHRRSPPLLGCFVRTFDEFYFEPTMDPPDRVPRGRFSPQSLHGDVFRPLGCRHGLVLIYNWSQLEVVVWDPVNGAQHHIALPPGFDILEVPIHIQGAVLRAATDIQHFQVILVGLENRQVIARVYSSETGGWGDIISMPLPPGVSSILYIGKPSVLVGDSLYWLIAGDFVRIIKFDLERQSLAVIAVPLDMHVRKHFQCSVMRADDGGLGFLFLSDISAQLLNRKTDCDGAASWVLGRTIGLDKLFTLNLHKEKAPLNIIGFAEENNVVFLSMGLGIFMIQLDSFQSKKISETSRHCIYHPFESVYIADTSIGGGRDGAELLNIT
uniref:Uncharacterized protein n=2 Tax=Avena sativa TaxID=4498 RepID=A0ACD5X3P2_AVESA